MRGLRTITGYNRVMAHRFQDDGHGGMIAEAVDDRLEPLRGLHYPATEPSRSAAIRLCDACPRWRETNPTAPACFQAWAGRLN